MVNVRNPSTIKCVFVGNSGVGKTKMVMDLLGIVDMYHSNHSYVKTLGVEIHPLCVNQKKYLIWDTAGHPPFMGLTSGYYILGNVFFIFKGGVGQTPQQWRNKILEVVPNATIYEVDNPNVELIRSMLSNY